MLVLFPGSRCTAHCQVLDSSPEACNNVPLEVRHYNHRVCSNDVGPYFYGIEMLLPYLDFCYVLAPEPIRNDKWSPDNRVIKTVLYGCCQVVNCIMPAPGIERVRIRDERFCSGCPDFLHYLPDKDRVDVTIVPVFSKMDLDCSQVLCSQQFDKPCFIKKFLDLTYLTLVGIFCPQVCKIDFACRMCPS